MREFTKSMVSFSWSMSLFGLQALTVSYQFIPSMVGFDLGAKYHFIGVSPSGLLDNGTPYWNAAPVRDNGDVAFIGQLMDVAHRRHLAVVRRHFEEVVDPSGQVVCGVGFADVTGFTALSRTLPLDQLAGLVSGFEAVTSEVVGSAGGRVVKHLGDAVMFVAATPTTLANVARFHQAVALGNDPAHGLPVVERRPFEDPSPGTGVVLTTEQLPPDADVSELADWVVTVRG